jgi:hypothetical protein
MTKHDVTPFTPCGKRRGRGAFDREGYECIGGMFYSQELHNGKWERVAKTCDCVKQWRNEKAGPQPALPDGKTKGGAA